MFNTAAKLQFGFAAVALVSAIVYGRVTGDPAIFILNMGIFVAFTLGGLAIAGAGVRDRAPRYLSADDAPPLEMVSVDRSLLSRPSWYPVAAAVAAGVFALGLAVGHVLVWVGLILAIIATGGWLAQSFREDPSYTPREGERVSQRLLAPVGLPVLAVALVGVIVISVSRVLLAVSKHASVAIAFGLAVVVLVAFFVIAARPKVGRAALTFLSGLALVAVITAGSVGAASGYRTFEKHENGVPPISDTAQNTKYRVDTLTVPVGEVVRISFDNLDRGTYHNVAVYTQNPGGTPIWTGEPIRGVSKIVYTTQFNQTGQFAFRCDFHPNAMTGTFTVVKP
jgi:plastocyanin